MTLIFTGYLEVQKEPGRSGRKKSVGRAPAHGVAERRKRVDV